MLFTLTASVNPKNHLKVKKNHEKSILDVWFDSKKTTSTDLYDKLFENIGKYKKLNVDINSFLQCEFNNISDKTVVLIIKTVVDHFNNFPYSMKSKKDNDDSEKKKDLKIVNCDACQNSKYNDICSETTHLVDSQRECKILQELPPNLLNPSIFINKAKNLLKNSKIEIEVIGKKDLKKHQLNLIENVGKASPDNSALMILKYLPIKDQAPSLLVGKGVCYDSGGLSIKTGNYMCGMKFDMSGAAVSLNTIHAIEKCKVEKNVIVLIPLVENLVNEEAYRPDDVIISHSGLTVEITNTDAEGRLILADAISYGAKTFNPKFIISIATLTGAVGYSLGYKHAGVWTTQDQHWDQLYISAQEAGEYIWRMPMHQWYLKDLKSCIADISNSAKTGAGGASRAAMFLKEFTHDFDFIHLDIANVAHLENENVATAPLLRTLFYFLKSC